MRVGIIRADLGPYGIYLSDLESRVQRNFSSHPPGQSRQVHYATDSILDAVLTGVGVVSVRGTDMAVAVDTTADNTLRIRKGSTDPYTVIAVPAGVATAKTAIRDALNNGFNNAFLPFVAEIIGTNQIQINSTAPANSGPTARLQIDTTGAGSTLNTAVGFAAGGTILTGLSVAALRAATFPTPLTIDVSTATITALSTWALLNASQQAALVEAIAEAIAPRFVETGQALLSFAFGVLAKMRSASFQPGGPIKNILPPGIAAAIVTDDGVTPLLL
jgi:hypothetical protein